MGFLDKLKDQAGVMKDKAVDTATKNSDKITGGLDKAGDFVDKKTKGKYTGIIATGKARAKEGLEKLDGKGTEPGTSSPPPSPDAFGTPTRSPDDRGTPPPPPPSDDPNATPPPLS